ncbi:MAG: hypothetical protein HQM14_17655 [SAR324 cluster bacterium]|nr:hypothetical protein [SAR324 cluster bacterium]
MQTIELPDIAVEQLKGLSEAELKERILTENGLTIAQEEKILNLNPNETTESMAPDDAIQFLQALRNNIDGN